MATLKYLSQYFLTTLNVGGGIDASQTTGIILQSVAGVTDISKPGQICITYSDPIDTGVAEWIDYTSINGSNELVGVTRGREGFSAHTHLQGATVAFVLSASHHNDIVDALKKVYNETTDTLLKATAAEVVTGTEDAKIVTPKGLKDAGITPNATFNRAFTWYLDGTSVVADEVGAKYIAPQNMTVTAIRAKTVSGTATIRVQKNTTDIDASISVTSTASSETTITSAAITAGEVITLDITAASSCVGLTVTVECTQP